MKYEIREDSGASEIIEAESLEAALEAAQEWSAGGSYNERVLVTVWATEIDDDGERGESLTGEVEAGPEPEPDEAECGDSDNDHDWQSPYEVVGGIADNPGCWSSGGTAMEYLEVCARCGEYKRTHTAGSQRNPGELPRTVTYLPADAKSRAWVAEQA